MWQVTAAQYLSLDRRCNIDLQPIVRKSDGGADLTEMIEKARKWQNVSIEFALEYSSTVPGIFSMANESGGTPVEISLEL
ncbi:MAG: hypothetical protein ABJN26_01230 [Stappiaceae bacterium]